METAGRRAKWTKIWDSGTLVTHMWCNFDLVVFKVTLGSVGARLKMACISKTARRRAKRSEIWDSWILVTYILGMHDLVVFNVIWGHSVHLSQNGLYLDNGWS